MIPICSVPVLPGTCISKVRRSTFAAFLLLSIVVVGFVPRLRADVDRTPVLSIGKHLVSAYQVDKNYQRFLSSASQTTSHPPSSDEVQAWFTRFFGQQIIIGQALEEGFGERKEVQTDVDRMERHMLTQTEGPFYEKLLHEENRDVDLKDAYQKLKKVLSVEVIRIPLSAPCANDLAMDRLSLAALGNAQKSGAVFYYKGDLAWPYFGFEDLAAGLEKATEPKSWWQFESAGLRVMARILEVKAQPVPPFEQVEETLRRMGNEAQKRGLRSKREEAILARYQFAFDWSGVLALLGTLKDRTAEIDEAAVELVKNQALATIKPEETITAVTIGDYVAYHNALYVKSAPGTPLDVFSEVQDLIVAKQDYRDALAAGVVSQAKFSEDRSNFRNYLALELYEKEKVRPNVAVTDEQVETYYRSHRETYLEPVKIEGLLLSFHAQDEAVAYVQRLQSGSDADPKNAPVQGTKIALTQETIAQFLPMIPWPLVADPNTKVFGPLPLPDGKEYRVWQRKAVIESSLKPLTVVAPKIRAALEQPLLEKREAALAHDLALKLAVNDHIDYKRYGINAEILKPWTN